MELTREAIEPSGRVGDVLLAVASFMLIVVSRQAPPTAGTSASSSNTGTMVVAAKNLPLGPTLVPETRTLKTIRQPVSAGAHNSAAMIKPGDFGVVPRSSSRSSSRSPRRN